MRRSDFRLRRSQNTLRLPPEATHEEANVRSAPARMAGRGLLVVRTAQAQIVGHCLLRLIANTTAVLESDPAKESFLFFNVITQMKTPEKKVNIY